MKTSDLFKVRQPEIRALHLTWIAFYICFFVWFNMAPLATSMLKSVDWLTADDLRLFAIANVAMTIPARILVGMALDKWGPRRVFSVLMVTMALPALAFAYGDTRAQLLISRLVLSSIGASFVVGIHMTAMWFKPRDIGFAEGFYAGWGNFGSAAAAMSLPAIALHMFGGDDGWRHAIGVSAVMMALYGVYYWYAITDGPAGTVHHRPRKVSAMEVSTWGDMIKLILWTIPDGRHPVGAGLADREHGLYVVRLGVGLPWRDRAGGCVPDPANIPGQCAHLAQGCAGRRQVRLQLGSRAEFHLLCQLWCRTGSGFHAADVLRTDLGSDRHRGRDDCGILCLRQPDCPAGWRAWCRTALATAASSCWPTCWVLPSALP
jgi:hypothetical protein